MKSKVFIVCGFASVALLAVVCIYGAWKPVECEACVAAEAFPTARKLLITTSNTTTTTDVVDGGSRIMPNRFGINGDGCSKDSLLVNQDPTPPLPGGIPTYSVYVENVCILAPNCVISDVHLRCGWFSSARLVNPNVFRRLDYNDCLLNDGKPIYPGDLVFFTYADTYAYPMEVTSVTCS